MKSKIFFFILLIGVVICNATVFAAGETGVYGLNISSSLSTMTVGSATSITVHAWTIDHRTNNVNISLGNGSSYSIQCDNSGYGSGSSTCDDSSLISYNTPGDYVITAKMCYLYAFGGITGCSTGTQVNPPYGECCVTETIQVQVDPAVLVCTPNGCNFDCPDNCTVAEDPDCGCLDGNGCCGIGCDNANDNDCIPSSPTPTTDEYDNPLVANDIIEFLWQMIVLIFTLLIPLAVLIIIIGAYVMITSGGNSSKFELGRKIVIWALIGFAIAVISRGIIHLVWMVMSG